MKLIQKRFTWLIVGTSGLDGLFFGFIDPRKAAAPLLIVGFVLLSLSIYMIWRGFLKIFTQSGLPFKSATTKLTGVITSLTVLVMALQSMGELTFRDLAVIMPLSLVAYFYLSYGRQNASRRV